MKKQLKERLVKKITNEIMKEDTMGSIDVDPWREARADAQEDERVVKRFFEDHAGRTNFHKHMKELIKFGAMATLLRTNNEVKERYEKKLNLLKDIYGEEEVPEQELEVVIIDPVAARVSKEIPDIAEKYVDDTLSDFGLE